MEVGQLLDLGVKGILLAAVIGLWRDNQQTKNFIQGLLKGQMDLNELARRAANERRKIGQAVGLDTLEDTAARRPEGLSEELKRRANR